MRIPTLIISLLFVVQVLAQTGDTMYIQGRHLYSAAGEKVILRGMNCMSVWSSDKTGQRTMPEVAKTGANSARLVWTQEYGNKKELAKLIDNCVANGMIAVPECHDATGKWSMLDTCINFWRDSLLIDAVMRNKRWTILNIGNEVGDHSVTAAQFEAGYSRAIDSLRGWGYTVPIMIDASSWGQNVDILFATWKAILAHDPLHNIIFSAHSYWETTANYNRIAEKSVQENMPIIIGEGPSITLPSNCKILDFGKGLDITAEHEIGWMSWSWGAASNNDCKPNFDHTISGSFGKWKTKYSLSLVVEHPHGLMRTSERSPSMFVDGIVPVSGLQMLPYMPEIFIGDSVAISVVVAPANAADKTYSLELLQDAPVLRLSADSSHLIALAQGTAELRTTSNASAVYGKSFFTVKELIPSSNEERDSHLEVYPIPLDGGFLYIRFSELRTGTLLVHSPVGIQLHEEQFSEKAYLSLNLGTVHYRGTALVQIVLSDGTVIDRKIIL